MEDTVASAGQPMGLLIAASAAAFAAFLAAGFTAWAAITTRTAARGQTFLGCLDKYISIMKGKTKAIEEKNATLARDFYRELLDLHWSEFHIWQAGVIPDKVMRAWLHVRRRNYLSDEIECQSNGTTVVVSYKGRWQELKSQHYFEETDPFVTFMDEVHAGPIANLKKLKKETKK